MAWQGPRWVCDCCDRNRRSSVPLPVMSSKSSAPMSAEGCVGAEGAQRLQELEVQLLGSSSTGYSSQSSQPSSTSCPQFKPVF